MSNFKLAKCSCSFCMYNSTTGQLPAPKLIGREDLPLGDAFTSKVSKRFDELGILEQKQTTATWFVDAE